LEVIVEKFGATKLMPENEQGHESASSSSPSAEKWVTVAPKKRGRTLFSGRRRNEANISVTPASPIVKVIPHNALDQVAAAAIQPVGTPAIQPIPTDPPGPPADFFGTGRPGTPVGGNMGLHDLSPVLEPASSEASGHLSSGSHVNASNPTSPLEGSDVEEDDVTMFLNLDNEEDVQMSSESSKKRRLEAGEASSPSHSLN